MDESNCLISTTLLFACSGGSNVGQLSNDICRELTQEEQGKMFCLAGIGGHVNNIIEKAKASDTVIAIDGCGVKCALKALEEADVPIKHHIILTELGVEKNGNLLTEPELVQDMKERIKLLIR